MSLTKLDQVIEVVTSSSKPFDDNNKQEEDVDEVRRISGSISNSKENSPEPIVEVKHTSSSSSASSSSENLSAQNQSNSDGNSTKLIRRRTIRRYHHRATVDDDNLKDSERNRDPPSSSVELTISINKSTSGSQPATTSCDQNQQEERACEFSGAATTRSQFRTRQIGGGYYSIANTNQQQQQINKINQQQQQQQHKQEQQTKTSSSSSSSSSLTSSTSTSKIAKCSITTNRKSTTSHHHSRELISESSSHHKLASKLEAKKTSSTMDTSHHLLAATTGKNNQLYDGGGGGNHRAGSILELDTDRASEVKQQQEESSVHHSRQSFSSSSTSTSMRAGSLRKAAMSSSLAQEQAQMMSRHSKNGALSSVDLSALSSSSSRHFKSASLTVSGGDQTDTTGMVEGDSTGGFLNSESLFSSPDVRSLVKEIGTDFAELENALSSTASGFRSARGASSLSSRLFGANKGRPLSPLGSTQYPAITAAPTHESLTSTTTSGGVGSPKIHTVKCERSQLSPGDLPADDSETSLPYKRNFYSSSRNLASPSSTSDLSEKSRSSSERIRDLMNQAQSHVDRYGISSSSSSSTISPDQTSKTLPARKSYGSQAASVARLSPDLSERRQDLQGKEKQNAADEGVKLHQSHCKAVMTESIERIDQRMSDLCKKFSESRDTKEAIDLLKLMIQMIEKAWSVPVCGDDLGFKLCNSLREAGGLDIILGFIQESDISRNTTVDNNNSYLLFNNTKSLPNSAEAKETGNKQAKTKNCPVKLRLNLSKLSQSSESAQSLDPPPTASPPDTKTTTKTTKDTSDSELLTSDLGLDSTSVESLSYVTPPTTDPTKTEVNGVTSRNATLPEQKPLDPSAVDPSSSSSIEVPTTETPAEEKQEEEEEEENLIKDELVFLSSRLLSQCLTSENRNYIVENGLDQVIRLACNLITMKSSQSKRLLSLCMVARKTSTMTSNNAPIINVAQEQQNDSIKRKISTKEDTQITKSSSQSKQPSEPSGGTGSDMHAVIGTEILQHLFKHSEDTCARMISLGGLEAILYGCRSSNIETLRHCASALANLALYGGPEGQQMMIEQKAHVWLFPLAFNEDDNIQYYACLAIVVLVANQEIEADVLKSSTLDLVEPFVTSHEPQKFAESTTSHIHGQSAQWLRRLIPLLESKREEARNLASFHFAMEAYIKKEQGQTQVFKEIGAVEPLRKVGSSPIAIASKFACQALRLIGEKEPHKLSQQVPLWTSEDVSEWVSQIGFERFKSAFVESRVDGDLLLQLDEEMLKTDIGIDNGIIRRRFLRELSYLKRIADYSSVDKSGLSQLLSSTGHDFVQYIYPMVQLGVTRDNIHMLDSEQLLRECRVNNTIHRMKLAQAIKELQEKMAVAAASNEYCTIDGGEQKTLDVFMSYRRSTGSQLASLLKVFLELRNFSVFIDVERLEAGKFDNNLLDSIKSAKNFILILSPNALDRCIGDHECKDWVHKEIVAALASGCNIIPIIDNFHWPDAEQLPEDMRSITYFNGVRWIHDYQDACVDKVERFIRGEINNGGGGGTSQLAPSVQSTQSSLQRLACGGSTYSSTPSMVATPSGLVAGFPSGSVSAYSSRVPFDADYHPLSFANQYLPQQQPQVTPSGGRRQV